MTTLSAALLFFLVLDPVGNIPFFVATLEAVAPKRRRWVVVRELVIALAVLVAFLLGGSHLLRFLGITEPALTVAGGIVLFLIALRMIFPGRGLALDEPVDGEPLVVPLAIPYVAGPSALAAVLLISSREPQRWPAWLLALTLAWLATGAILLAAAGVGGLLGRRGLIAIERLMGMLLTTIAVQMLLSGLGRFLGLPPVG